MFKFSIYAILYLVIRTLQFPFVALAMVGISALLVTLSLVDFMIQPFMMVRRNLKNYQPARMRMWNKISWASLFGILRKKVKFWSPNFALKEICE